MTDRDQYDIIKPGDTLEYQYMRDGEITGGGVATVELITPDRVEFEQTDETWCLHPDGEARSHYDSLAEPPRVVNVRVVNDS